LNEQNNEIILFEKDKEKLYNELKIKNDDISNKIFENSQLIEEINEIKQALEKEQENNEKIKCENEKLHKEILEFQKNLQKFEKNALDAYIQKSNIEKSMVLIKLSKYKDYLILWMKKMNLKIN